MSTEATAAQQGDEDAVVTQAVEKIGAGLAAREGSGKNAGTQNARKDQSDRNDSGSAKGPETKGGSDVDLAALQARLVKLESEQDVRQAAREADDVVDSFIREVCPDCPKEMMRKLLPRTKDKNQLMAGVHQINKWFQEHVNNLVKRGMLKHVDVGGISRDGGTTPSQEKFDPSSATPSRLIEQGLNSRRKA